MRVLKDYIMTVAKVLLHKNGDSPHRLLASRLPRAMFVKAQFMNLSNLAGTVPIFATVPHYRLWL